jgi:hypothetical protein
MSKRRTVTMGFVLGMAVFSSACAATVGDPVVDEDVDVEDVDVEEETLELTRLPRRIRLPNPIDPGRRLFRCLPDPRKEYLVRDPEVCAAIRFFCSEGVPFFDRCGCGCEVGLSR